MQRNTRLDTSVQRVISEISALIVIEKGRPVLAAGDLSVLHGQAECGNACWAVSYTGIFDRLRAAEMEFVVPQAPYRRRADPWPDELPQSSAIVSAFHTRHRLSRQTGGNATSCSPRQILSEACMFVLSTRLISGVRVPIASLRLNFYYAENL